MSFILSLIIAFSIGFTGSPSQAPTEAPTEAVQALSEAPLQAPEAAPMEPKAMTVEQAYTWASFLLEQADMELTPNVTLSFSSTVNCGAELSTAGLGGCTYTVAADTYVVVISPELAWTQMGTHIFFHELAHTVGMGECAAEAYAQQFEEIPLWSYPNCETTGKP